MTHSGDNRKLSEGEWQPHCDVSGRLARSISEALLSKWQLPIRRAVSVVFCHFLVSNATNGSHFFIVAIDSVRCVRCVLSVRSVRCVLSVRCVRCVRCVLSVRSVRCVLSVRSVRCVFCYSRGPTGETSLSTEEENGSPGTACPSHPRSSRPAIHLRPRIQHVQGHAMDVFVVAESMDPTLSATCVMPCRSTTTSCCITRRSRC